MKIALKVAVVALILLIIVTLFFLSRLGSTSGEDAMSAGLGVSIFGLASVAQAVVVVLLWILEP